MTPCPCSYTLLETVKTVEAKLRLTVGAGNESLTQEKPPPPSSARAQIRKELLLPDFFLTPLTPNVKYRNKHAGLLCSQKHPFPITICSDLAFPMPSLVFFFFKCSVAKPQPLGVTAAPRVRLPGLTHSHHERSLRLCQMQRVALWAQIHPDRRWPLLRALLRQHLRQHVCRVPAADRARLTGKDWAAQGREWVEAGRRGQMGQHPCRAPPRSCSTKTATSTRAASAAAAANDP